MELVIAAVVIGIGILLWWAISRPARGMVDDSCPLDYVRRPEQAKRDNSPAAPPPPSPSPEGQVDPAIQHLVRGLRSDMPAAAAEAARALGESGHAEAVGPLIQALQREQRSIQFAVVEALLALGPLAVSAVEEGRENGRDPAIRGLLKVIHEQLERKASGQPMLPTQDILKMSPKLLDEITKELKR